MGAVKHNDRCPDVFLLTKGIQIIPMSDDEQRACEVQKLKRDRTNKERVLKME